MIEDDFKKQSGVSKEEAIETIKKWIKTKEYQKANEGLEEIINFFPEDEQLKKLLKIIQGKKIKTKIVSNIKKSTENFTNNNAEKIEDSEKITATLCYAYFFVIIPLFLKRDSDFVQFHAWQGITLTTILFFFNFIFFNILLSFFSVLVLLFQVLIIGLYIWGGYSAYQGKRLKLPIIHKVSEKIRKLFTN